MRRVAPLFLVLSITPSVQLLSSNETLLLSDKEKKSLAAISGYQILSGSFEEESKTLEAATHPVRTRQEAEIFNPFLARSPRKFHGSIYEFHRNDNLDTRNFFDPPGQKLPEFKRNQFGFQLSGPLFQETEFLIAYDGFRVVQGQTRLTRVPSQAMKLGDFSEVSTPVIDPLTGTPFPGNMIPRSRIHPVSRNLLPVISDPNREDPTRNFVNNNPRVDNGDLLLLRLDHQLSPDSKLASSYQLRDNGQIRTGSLPGFDRHEEDTDHSLSLSYHRNFSAHLSNQLRFRAFRSKDLNLSENGGRTGLLDSVGINGVSVSDPLEEGYPRFQLSGYADFGDSYGLPETAIRNWFHLENVLTYNIGDHNLTIGAEYEKMFLNRNRTGGIQRGLFEFSGFFTGDAFADFLLGIPDQATRGVGSDRNDLRNDEWEVYLDNRWRLNPFVSLSAGITYNYFSPYRSVSPVSILYPFLVQPVQESEILVSGTQRAQELGFGAGHSLVVPDRNDWAPRLALALSPAGNSRLVIRAGYGIHYSPLSSGRAGDFIGRNAPFFRTDTAVSTRETPEIDLSDPFSAQAPAELAFRGIESDLDTAYTQDWNLTVQNQFSRNWSLQASYRGTKGTELQRIVPGNFALPGPGQIQERRADPAFGPFTIVSSGASSSRHGLGLDVERKLAEGMALRSGFDWARSISDSVSYHASDPSNLAAERARSSSLPLRRAYLNYILDLPVNFKSGWIGSMISGWRVSGVTQIQDGEAFSVGLPGDFNNDGVEGDRPVRIGDGSLPASDRSIDLWFDTSAFLFPEEFGLGDSGRNILVGPGLQSWDVGLSKTTEIADGHQVELRFEFFNAFNKTNFDRPSSVLGTPTFGTIFGAGRGREVEIALKYSF